jgi:hypothetical protein
MSGRGVCRALLLGLAVAGCRYEGAGVTDGRGGGDAFGAPDAGAPADAAGDASPILDTDEDGIVDASDNCPNAANADQRDWDVDLHGDVCDHCPHKPSSADPDGDGDLVGDACDPHPGTPGEVPVIWLGFHDPADITGWVNTGGNGQWSVADALLHETAAGFSLLDSPGSYTDAYFEVGLTVVSPDTNEIGFCLSDIQPGIQYYCCGVSNTGGVASARAVSAWATSGGQIATPGAFSAANLAIGQLVDMTGLLDDAAFTCAITQGTITTNPATQTGDKLGTAVFYTTTPVDYRYAFVVTVP